MDLASLFAGQVEEGPLPMRFSYGPRYNQATGRMDSPDLKSVGFFGPVSVGYGGVASEYSMGSDIGDFPSIAEGMPKNLLAQAMSAARFQQPVPAPAANFAEQVAAARMAQGRSPFWEQGRDPYPQWSPEQYWESPAIMPRR